MTKKKIVFELETAIEFKLNQRTINEPVEVMRKRANEIGTLQTKLLQHNRKLKVHEREAIKYKTVNGVINFQH